MIPGMFLPLHDVFSLRRPADMNANNVSKRPMWLHGKFNKP
jgi:hypothetical protein